MQRLTNQQQVHYLCNNNDMPASPELIGHLLTALGSLGLIPNTGTEFNAKTGSQNKFIIMVSTTANFQVQFPQGEVVFISQDMELEVFLAKVNDVLGRLHAIFPSKLANRLSIISTEIWQGSEQEYAEEHNQLFSEQGEPFEWDARRAYKGLTSNGEQINKITTIRRCEAQVGGNFVDSLVYEVDCNTVFQNTNFRFDLSTAQAVLAELSREATVLMESARS